MASRVSKRLATNRGEATSSSRDGPRLPTLMTRIAGAGGPRAPWLIAFKARTIIDTARAGVADAIGLEALGRVADGMAIGRRSACAASGCWTAEYVLARGLAPRSFSRSASWISHDAVRLSCTGSADHRAPPRPARAGAFAKAIVEVRSGGEAGWW